MKRTLAVVSLFSMAAIFSAAGVEKPKSAAKKKPGSPASASKMIVMPPATDPAITGQEPPKLISSEMSGKDLQFFTTAVEAGRFQAYLVEILKTKAASDQIKALGSALAMTQEQENHQITRLAAAKGWSVSMVPTATEKAFGAKLEKQESFDFDKTVMDKVIAMVQQSVAAYEEAAHSEDKDIKEFGAQMLPLAQEKLKYAEKMTGAGKSAAQLFRKSVPAPSIQQAPAPAGGSTAEKPIPPAIIPSKTRPAITPAEDTKSTPASEGGANAGKVGK